MGGPDLTRSSLITAEDVRSEIHRLFDAGPDGLLVIRVYGEDGDAKGADETFREMLASLQMYDDRYRQGTSVTVRGPTKDTLARAMTVIGREEHQKKILAQALTVFGRRFIDPLAGLIDTAPDGSLVTRLVMTRDLFMAQVTSLNLTPETRQILMDDLKKLLSDDYLAMVAENEERVQRPRVTQLAQHVLRVIGSIFRRAFDRWPVHAEQIASAVARRLQADVSLRDLPVVLRDHVTKGIEEFLWVETSNEIDGSLRALFAEYRGSVDLDVPPLDRDAYHDLARACWQVIAENC